MKENQNNNVEVYQNDEIDLIEILITLWNKKIFIILFTVILTIIVGGFLYISTPKSYEASVSFNNIGAVPSNLSRNSSSDLSGKLLNLLSNNVAAINNKQGISVSNFLTVKNLLYSNSLLKKLSNELNNINITDLKNSLTINSYPDISSVQKDNDVNTITGIKLSLKISDIDTGLDSLKTISNTLVNQYIQVILSYTINNIILSYNDEVSQLSINRTDLTDNLPVLEKQLNALKKIKQQNSKTNIESNSPNLQFDIGQNLDYLPISNQIDMLNSKIVKTQANIDDITVKIQKYRNLINSLENLNLEYSKSSAIEKNDIFNYLQKLIKKDNNELSQAVLKGMYTNILTQYNSFDNRTFTTTVTPTKFLLKTTISFVIFLFISIVFVLINEAVKNHNTNKAETEN